MLRPFLKDLIQHVVMRSFDLEPDDALGNLQDNTIRSLQTMDVSPAYREKMRQGLQQPTDDAYFALLLLLCNRQLQSLNVGLPYQCTDSLCATS